AIETGHAPVHHHEGRGVALPAELRALRKVRAGEGVGLLRARLELGALFFHEFLLVLVELALLDEPDGLQVALNDMTELGDDRGHELATRLPVASARVED